MNGKMAILFFGYSPPTMELGTHGMELREKESKSMKVRSLGSIINCNFNE